MIKEIPNGTCGCGCGAPLYRRTYSYSGMSPKTVASKFLRGHNQRVDGFRGSQPTDAWSLRKDVVPAGPVTTLVVERAQQYGISLFAMGKKVGYPYLDRLPYMKYLHKPKATLILRGLLLHYPPKLAPVEVKPPHNETDHLFRHKLPFTPKHANWEDFGSCKNEPMSTFFPPVKGLDEVATARAICSRCPVLMDCLGSALSVGENFGIWGGVWFENLKERKIALRTYGATHSVQSVYEEIRREVARHRKG